MIEQLIPLLCLHAIVWLFRHIPSVQLLVTPLRWNLQTHHGRMQPWKYDTLLYWMQSEMSLLKQIISVSSPIKMFTTQSGLITQYMNHTLLCSERWMKPLKHLVDLGHLSRNTLHIWHEHSLPLTLIHLWYLMMISEWNFTAKEINLQLTRWACFTSGIYGNKERKTNQACLNFFKFVVAKHSSNPR